MVSAKKLSYKVINAVWSKQAQTLQVIIPGEKHHSFIFNKRQPLLSFFANNIHHNVREPEKNPHVKKCMCSDKFATF